MPMIKCPECGKEISELAEKCPNCGFPIGFSSTTSNAYNSQSNINAQQSYNKPVMKSYEAKPKQSTLGILALIFSVLGCTFWIGIILAIIDLCRKDEKKKVCSIIAICISVIWIILAVSVGGTDNNPSTQNANTEDAASTTVIQDEKVPSKQAEDVQEEKKDNKKAESQSEQMNREDFINSCSEMSYKTLARNPEDYIGEHIVLTIKISQIIQGGLFDNNQYYRVYTNDDYGMWLGDEYFMYDSRANQDIKILQDDILTVYAEFAGTETVERALTGTKEEVLSIKAIYIDLIDDESYEDNSYNINSSEEDSSVDDGLTMGQKNALNSAKQYLSWSAFSYQGLVSQLEYEQYSHEEAVFAADNCGADWNEQAVKSAKSYLEFSSFSKEGLIQQLEFEGFTHEQAVYGAEQNGY